MATILSPDDMDWEAYERDTEFGVKVRPASHYRDAVRSAFAPRDDAIIMPTMGSTKLGEVLEFRPGEVTLWAGYNGHYKSMLTGQVATDLCTANQRTMVASFEMLVQQTLARQIKQAYGGQHPTSAYIDRFMSWTDDKLWMLDHLGRITPGKLIAILRYFADKLSGVQVIIDSMMMVCASEERLDEQKQFGTDIVRLAKETGMHLHVLAHCRKPGDANGEDRPPTRYDVRGAAALVDQVDNVCMVWRNKPKERKLKVDRNDEHALAQGDLLVVVDKQRNFGWEGKVHLWLDKKSLRICNDRASETIPFNLGDAHGSLC